MANYVYSQPTTSPLYDSVISPSCDYIVDNYLPKWLTPNAITLIGLLCVTTSFVMLNLIEAKREYYIVSAVLWFSYGVLDNLDGKQARRLGMSCNSGEFLDHAVDSLVTSMLGLSFQIMHNRSLERDILVVLSYQVPFYFACWFHFSTGRLIIGNSISGKPYFTVDELNLFFVPLFILLEYLTPGLWRCDLKLPYFDNITVKNWGVAFNYCCFAYSMLVQTLIFASSIRDSLHDSHYLVLPLLAHILLKEHLKINIYFTIFPFSVLCATFIFLKISKTIPRKGCVSLLMLMASSFAPLVLTKLMLEQSLFPLEHARNNLLVVFPIQLATWSGVIYAYSRFLEKQSTEKKSK